MLTSFNFIAEDIGKVIYSLSFDQIISSDVPEPSWAVQNCQKYNLVFIGRAKRPWHSFVVRSATSSGPRIPLPNPLPTLLCCIDANDQFDRVNTKKNRCKLLTQTRRGGRRRWGCVMERRTMHQATTLGMEQIHTSILPPPPLVILTT
jgi:hypothetical protein